MYFCEQAVAKKIERASDLTTVHSTILNMILHQIWNDINSMYPAFILKVPNRLFCFDLVWNAICNDMQIYVSFKCIAFFLKLHEITVFWITIMELSRFIIIMVQNTTDFFLILKFYLTFWNWTYVSFLHIDNMIFRNSKHFIVLLSYRSQRIAYVTADKSRK